MFGGIFTVLDDSKGFCLLNFSLIFAVYRVSVIMYACVCTVFLVSNYCLMI